MSHDLNTRSTRTYLGSTTPASAHRADMARVVLPAPLLSAPESSRLLPRKRTTPRSSRGYVTWRSVRAVGGGGGGGVIVQGWMTASVLPYLLLPNECWSHGVGVVPYSYLREGKDLFLCCPLRQFSTRKNKHWVPDTGVITQTRIRQKAVDTQVRRQSCRKKKKTTSCACSMVKRMTTVRRGRQATFESPPLSIFPRLPPPTAPHRGTARNS